MKKRNCRRTSTEKLQHEFAVKIRKMTDAAISVFFDGIYKEAECLKSIEIGQGYVCDFVNSLHPGKGLEPATIEKIKAYATGFCEECEFLPPEGEDE